jgi:hypothetical protein
MPSTISRRNANSAGETMRTYNNDTDNANGVRLISDQVSSNESNCSFLDGTLRSLKYMKDDSRMPYSNDMNVTSLGGELKITSTIASDHEEEDGVDVDDEANARSMAYDMVDTDKPYPTLKEYPVLWYVNGNTVRHDTTYSASNADGGDPVRRKFVREVAAAVIGRTNSDMAEADKREEDDEDGNEDVVMSSFSMMMLPPRGTPLMMMSLLLPSLELRRRMLPLSVRRGSRFSRGTKNNDEIEETTVGADDDANGCCNNNKDKRIVTVVIILSLSSGCESSNQHGERVSECVWFGLGLSFFVRFFFLAGAGMVSTFRMS